MPAATKRQSSRPEEALGAADPSSWLCRAWGGLCSLLGVLVGSRSLAAMGQWWAWLAAHWASSQEGQERAGHGWTRKPLQRLSGEEAPAKATKAIGGSKHPTKQVAVLSDD